MSCIKAELIVETKDKKIVQEANSLLKNFFLLLERHLAKRYVTVKTTSGSDDSGNNQANTFGVNAGSGDSNYGIVVGSGSTAVDICNDYALENKLDLDYSGVTIENTTCESGIIEIAIKRDITNNSGSDVTINEVGLYCHGKTTSYFHCIDRTVLVESVTLQNEQTMKVTYKLKYVA